MDMLRNLVGAMFTVFFLNPSGKVLSGKKILSLQLLTILSIVFTIFPLAAALTDELIAGAEFPVLADFETPMEKTRWTGSAPIEIGSEEVRNGSFSLKVFLKTSKYSGTSLRYFPGKWQGYGALSFDVFNPSSEPLRMTCRIHDRQHTLGVQRYSDRFNKSFQLKKGWNSVLIDLEEVANAPKTRRMDMGDICGLGVFVVRLPAPRVMYLDSVRLLKKPVAPPEAYERNHASP